MPHDVFISYSNIDKTTADAACATFEQHGIRCWIAPRDVPAGSEWAESIMAAIESARIMVLIFSTHSNESRQVRREIELAVSRGLTIMPLRLEKIAPTKSMAYYMAGVHWIDALTPPLEQHFAQMVEWIAPHLGGEPTPEAEPAPPPRRKATAKAGPAPGPGATPKPAKPKTKPAAELTAAADTTPPFRKPDAVAGRGNAAGSALDIAEQFRTASRHAEALAVLDDLLTRQRNSLELATRIEVAKALVLRSSSLAALGRYDDAITGYDELVDRFGRAKEAALIVQLAAGAWGRGSTLSRAGRAADAVAAYDAAILRYQGAADLSILEVVAASLFSRAIELTGLGRHKDAIMGYRDLVSRYSDRTEQAIREYVAKALYNLGNRQSAAGDKAEAIANWSTLIGGYMAESGVRSEVARAMLNKAIALRDTGREGDALLLANDLVGRFATSVDPIVKDAVRNGKLLQRELS